MGLQLERDYKCSGTISGVGLQVLMTPDRCYASAALNTEAGFVGRLNLKSEDNKKDLKLETKLYIKITYCSCNGN